MKLKKIIYPVIMIIIFVFIMNAAFFFHPYIYSVPDLIEEIEQSVLSGDWQTANKKTNDLIRDIKRDKFPWMQFSIEREEIDNLIINLYELKGSISITDTPSAIRSIYGLRANWSNLGS